MDRSLAVGGVIAAAVVVVAMIAIAGTDGTSTARVESRDGVKVEAPMADVKSDADNVRVKTPFVDVDVPKSKSSD